ncbi:class I SAM-dependent methyltransferase [bacterium]|nr:class I SAM-dependent methyltransferase [bacterium]
MKQSTPGYGSNLMRAMENLIPPDKRLFEDPYSEKFLSPFWKFWVILMRSPLDFSSQELGEELKKAGYSFSSPTLFIWEGGTQYLSKKSRE